MSSASTSLEAKLVVLGSQGVGKTSLVHRYVKSAFVQRPQSTVGASFLTSRVHDAESGATIRLQIWDTAGQERYRSISRLYYRGAHAAILCYDVTSEKSFHDMATWLRELKEHCGPETIIHFVGTKTDAVAADPDARQVAFDQCIEFVATQSLADAATAAGTSPPQPSQPPAAGSPPLALVSPDSKRSSGFWGHEHIWNCHEVSARDGDGIDEVFRVVVRELVDQHLKRQRDQAYQLGGAPLATPLPRGRTPGAVDPTDPAAGYFDHPTHAANAAFRVGLADQKRRSWLGFPTPLAFPTPLGGPLTEEYEQANVLVAKGMKNKKCC